MELTTDIALSRLVAQQRALDVTATNLANASTPGFKAERVVFSDWLSRQTGTSAPRGGAKPARQRSARAPRSPACRLPASRRSVAMVRQVSTRAACPHLPLMLEWASL